VKKRVSVIGGGFAGIAAARVFSRFEREIECTVFDRKEHFEFLPLLPDVIGGKIRSGFLRVSLPDLSKKFGFRFRNESVENVALSEKSILAGKGAEGYDYLLISCGSETDFYGNAGIESGACKLDGVDDAERIIGMVGQDRYETYLVSGGGYTGVEVAANLKFRLEKTGKRRKVIMVEGGPCILGRLPGWVREYAATGLKKAGIECLVNTKVAGIEKETVFLSDGRRLPAALLIWTAGVRTPDFLRNADSRKTEQGRIYVDEYLKTGRSCFLAGDAAGFVSFGQPLRMSVQFALSEGRRAAFNIIKEIRGAAPERYRPFDPGYIVPMAAGRACGEVLGVNVRGRAALALHYIMSVYRSCGLRNKSGILFDLIKAAFA